MGRGHVHLRLGVRYLEYRALQWAQALTTQRTLFTCVCVCLVCMEQSFTPALDKGIAVYMRERGVSEHLVM